MELLVWIPYSIFVRENTKVLCYPFICLVESVECELETSCNIFRIKLYRVFHLLAGDQSHWRQRKFTVRQPATVYNSIQRKVEI